MITSNAKQILGLIKQIEDVVENKSVELAQKMLEDTASEAQGDSNFQQIANNAGGIITVTNLDNGASLEATSDKDKPEYAVAYREFGTGKYFKSRGSGSTQDGDEQTYEQYASNFLGKVKPRTGTIPHTPFLFPYFFKNRDEFVQNMINEIKKLK